MIITLTNDIFAIMIIIIIIILTNSKKLLNITARSHAQLAIYFAMAPCGTLFGCGLREDVKGCDVETMQRCQRQFRTT